MIRILQNITVLMLLAISLSTYGFEHSILISEFKIQSPNLGNCSSATLQTKHWKSSAHHNMSKQQQVCLRTMVTLEVGDFERPTSISLSMLGASRIYWDGELVGENGLLGIDQTSEVAGIIDFVIPIPATLLTQGTHQIAIEASTYHLNEKLSSNFVVLRIVETQDASDFFKRHSRIASFFIGGLLVIALLFQLFFWLYQRQNVFQVFSLFCLTSTLLLLAEEWRFMFGYTYDLHLTRLCMMLACTVMVSLLLPYFYLVYYRFTHKRIWLLITTITMLMLSLWIINSAFRLNINTLLFCSLVITLGINLLALKRKHKNTWPSVLIILAVLIVFSIFPQLSFVGFLPVTSIAIVLVFSIVLGMLISLIQEMKVNRMQSLAAVRLESELLKRNLQPHFLMNSLMLVIEWIEQQPDAAVTFVQALAEEMRMLVKFSSLSEVSLEEELTLCARHIEIMAYRYNADYSLDISGDTAGIIVPPAIIHTQIENAFSHNHMGNGAVFTLNIERDGPNVELVLTSPINIKSKTDSLGIGERYIRLRLKEKFGQHFVYQSHAKDQLWINTITFRNTI